ncbi:hypothetical protein F0U60_10525 [Archangium minus]|uniref:RsbT co-antagonist protein RsbRD N-terminal domain-containing protein n=2 Tax=Archangiaceae TaxID=39 RepID=A0ABY9WRX8_9BACT|nr:hypothetical protein F0U60_10525 [Archangium minus]
MLIRGSRIRGGPCSLACFNPAPPLRAYPPFPLRTDGSAAMDTLADMMEAGREQLFARWLERVQQHHAPGPLTEPELADHIPDFLREVIAALRREEEGSAPKTHRVGPLGWEHGEQRFRIGFDLPSVVREYGELHECIFELVEERGHALLRLEEAWILLQCFNRAIADAVAHFMRMRERELTGGVAHSPAG